MKTKEKIALAIILVVFIVLATIFSDTTEEDTSDMIQQAQATAKINYESKR